MGGNPCVVRRPLGKPQFVVARVPVVGGEGHSSPQAPGTHQSPDSCHLRLREARWAPTGVTPHAVRSAPCHANAQLLLEHLLSTCHRPHASWHAAQGEEGEQAPPSPTAPCRVPHRGHLTLTCWPSRRLGGWSCQEMPAFGRGGGSFWGFLCLPRGYLDWGHPVTEQTPS